MISFFGGDMELLRSIVRLTSKHKFISFFVLAAVVGVFLSIRFVMVRSEGVTSDPIKKGMAVDAVYGIGTVMASHSFAGKPGLVSHITNLYVKEGDKVHKGDKLVDIDQTVFYAPFNGVVNYLPFKIGENVFPQLPVVVVTDLSDRYMLVSLEQQAILRVQPGQKVKISFDTLRQVELEGVVQSTYSYNGNFIARVQTPNLPPEILPDMTADVAIIIREISDALLIPAAAYEDGFVWVRREHALPTKVPIKIGIVDQAKVQVISGDLKEGDQVMIRRKLTQ
jgi:multidrug efflux pump subunit AcrA (membrane-fusion protein)